MLAFLVATSIAQASTPIETELSIGGSRIGTNFYSVKADGSIESVSTGKIQGFDLSSKLTIKFKDGVATEATLDDKISQGEKVLQGIVVNAKEDKAKYTVAGQAEKEAPLKLTTPIFANFHPQLLSAIFKKVDWKSQKTVDVAGTLIQNAANITFKVTPLRNAEVTVVGKQVPVSFAKLSIAALEGEVAFADDGKVVGFDIPSQKFQQILKGAEEVFKDPMAQFPELSQRKFEAQTEFVVVPLADGTKLSTMVTKPKGKGPFPVILVRTSYGKEAQAADADTYARRGYVFVSQDVRGTGKSSGEFDPFVYERKDGHATIDWVSKQSWCNQNVGMIGGSYLGLVQWCAAVEKHPALKCIVPQVSPPASAMWNLPYENGTFTLLPDLWWLRLVDDPKGMNLMSAGDPVKNLKALNHLPLSEVDNKVLGWNSKNFDRWLKRETAKDWPTWDFESSLAEVKIPVLHISGWFDGDQIGTQRNWQALSNAGHKSQWLIYGPWTHAFNTTTSVGGENFGKDSILELDSLYLRWFDTWLKGKSVNLDQVPKVKYFAQGVNKWKTSDSWPPVEAKAQTLEFELAKSSRGAESTSKLVSKTVRPTSTSYLNDPAKNKVSSDTMSMSDEGTLVIGKKELKDMVVLRSEPLASDQLVTGPFEVEFDFQCSAKDTDFYAVLYREMPGGKFFAVCRPGKLRASYIGGFDAVRALVPNQTYRAKFQLWDAACHYRKGDRIAISISSNMFPMTARNLGTAEPLFSGTKMLKQTNTILSSPGSPGRLRYWVQ
jgi:uncharacterized protein